MISTEELLSMADQFSFENTNGVKIVVMRADHSWLIRTIHGMAYMADHFGNWSPAIGDRFGSFRREFEHSVLEDAIVLARTLDPIIPHIKVDPSP